MAIIFRLRPRTRFWWFVLEDGVNTYQEFMNRAAKHTSAKETTTYHKDGKVDPHHPAQTKDEKIDKGPMLDRRERERHCPYSKRFYEYHPLSTTLEGVFIYRKDKEVFYGPYQNKNSIETKYYRYHKSVRHNTDECRDLNEQVAY